MLYVRQVLKSVFICESFSQFPLFAYRSQHTTFISSNDTVPYNVHSVVYGTNTTATTKVTTIGEIGDTVLAGLIHWPTNLDRWAIVTVGSKQWQVVRLNS